MHTGFVSHARCSAHEMGSWHPECPGRLAAIHDHLIAVGLLQSIYARGRQAAAGKGRVSPLQ